MLRTLRNRIAARACSAVAGAAARRFARRQDGAAAIEFALVALPFLALMFAIMETALVFFAGQTLEAAAADSARLIMTGQAQTSRRLSATGADFKTSGLRADCRPVRLRQRLYVDVKSYSNFAAIDTATPVDTNGQLTRLNNAPIPPGGPGAIVVVPLYYQWPIYVSLLGNNLANLTAAIGCWWRPPSSATSPTNDARHDPQFRSAGASRPPVRRDRRGVSAVEFALLPPLMIALYLGCVEISDGVAVDRKVSLTAGTRRQPGRASRRRSAHTPT